MNRDAEEDELQPAPPPVFLERQSYRRRRLNDAARLLPLRAAGLFAVPLLWPQGEDGAAAIPMSSAILYVFAIWAALIVVAALFGFAARRWTGREARDPESR